LSKAAFSHACKNIRPVITTGLILLWLWSAAVLRRFGEGVVFALPRPVQHSPLVSLSEKRQSTGALHDAAALLLLPFGASTIRMLRKTRAA
jgi:hypothetical protein